MERNIKQNIDYVIQRNTCSKSCGQKLRMANKVPEKWVDKAVELRQQGIKLSAIAVVVNKSTSTVWQYLKKRGY